MAVGAWTFYNKFRKNIGAGNVNLLGTMKMALYTSASNAATATLSTKGSVTSEVTGANGYATGGAALAATVTWTAGASAGQLRFNAGTQSWKASGGTIPNIKFAVIWASAATPGAKLVCYSQLSTAQFTLSANNTISITPSATGIFNLA